MATKMQFEGREVEIIDDWRVGEQVAAENALGIDMMSDKTSDLARMLVVVYMSIRRTEEGKTMQPGFLADLVMRMNFSDFASLEEADAGPPAGSPDADGQAKGNGQETEEPPISGVPASDSSESPSLSKTSA